MFQSLCHAMFDVVAHAWKEPKCAKWFWDNYVAGDWGSWALCFVEMAGNSHTTRIVAKIHVVTCILDIFDMP